MVMEVITVTYQDDVVGAVSFDTEKGLGAFEYDSGFIKIGYLQYSLSLGVKRSNRTL